MDLDDISPAAVILGLIGALIVVVMMSWAGRNPDVTIGIFWKVLSPLLTFVACFFIVQRMADN